MTKERCAGWWIRFWKTQRPFWKNCRAAVLPATRSACRYCVAGCPKQISIPDLFAVMNTRQIYHDWNADYYYNVVHTGGGKAKASECIKCGKCEKDCLQHLHIRELLEAVANEFENRQ